MCGQCSKDWELGHLCSRCFAKVLISWLVRARLLFCDATVAVLHSHGHQGAPNIRPMLGALPCQTPATGSECLAGSKKALMARRQKVMGALLELLASAMFCQGVLSKALQLLEKRAEVFKGNHSLARHFQKVHMQTCYPCAEPSHKPEHQRAG